MGNQGTGMGEGGRSQMPGIEVPRAWDLLQEANYKYPELIKEVNLRILDRMIQEGRINPRDRDNLVVLLNKAQWDKEQAVPEDIRKQLKLEKRQREAGKKVKQKYQITPNEAEDLKTRLDETGINMEEFFPTQGTEPVDADPDLGLAPTCYSVDSDDKRKSAVKSLLIEKMGLPEKEAKKSLQLA